MKPKDPIIFGRQRLVFNSAKNKYDNDNSGEISKKNEVDNSNYLMQSKAYSNSADNFNEYESDDTAVSNALISKEKAPFKCSDVKYLTGAWTLIRIAAPFIIILFGSLDFIKAVMASDEKKMKESKGKFIKRLIAFILFIVLPFVVQFIFSNMGTYGSDNMCLVKCIVTKLTLSSPSCTSSAPRRWLVRSIRRPARAWATSSCA